jgi:hypothetical protein
MMIPFGIQKYIHRPFVREIREGDDVRCFSTCLEGCKKGADKKDGMLGICVDALGGMHPRRW